MGYGEYLEKNYPKERKTEILQLLADRTRTIPEFLQRLEGLEQLVQEKKSDNESRLILSTIHSAKGLEYDTVYLLDIIDGVLPEEPVQVTRNTDPEIVRLLEEDRRLFYVGISRAKKRLNIFERKDQSSMFLREAFAADETTGSDIMKKVTTEKRTGLELLPKNWKPVPGETIYPGQIRRENVDGAAADKARAAGGGTNETRGRFHIGHDRFGTVLFPCKGVIA